MKLDDLVRRELDIPIIRSTFLTDSQITLAYIKNDSKQCKVFVANRVTTIMQHTSPDQWDHIRGNINPADVLSRVCDAGKVPEIWFHAPPPFLSRYKCDWPVVQTTAAGTTAAPG